MTADLQFLRCPLSHGKLVLAEDGNLFSPDASRTYPVFHGIPDFRLFDPPYMSREEDHATAAELLEAARKMDYDGLVRYYETKLCPPRPQSTVEKSISHRISLRLRARKRLHYLFDRAGGVTVPGDRVILDLGCGSGEALLTLLELGSSRVIGIDISLVELVFARKLLTDHKHRVQLVAGCAESLPFAGGTFGFIYSPDVIEHVTSQQEYLREAYRVLGPGAKILLNSPNRYSVVCPEPHVGIWGLGFLPRVLMDPCCRLLGKGPYVGKRLASLRELRKLVSTTFDQYNLTARASNPNSRSVLGKLYHALRPLSVNAFALFCDQHVVVASKRLTQ